MMTMTMAMMMMMMMTAMMMVTTMMMMLMMMVRGLRPNYARRLGRVAGGAQAASCLMILIGF